MQKITSRGRLVLMFSCAVTFLFLTLTSTSQAYIPPSFFVVRQMARKHSDVVNTRFVNRITFFKGTTPLGSPLEETIQVISDNKIHTSIRNSSGHAVTSIERILSSAKDNNAARYGLPILYSLQFISNSALVADHFRQLGINIKSQGQLYGDKDPTREDLPYKMESSMALTRFNNRTAIVLNGDGRSLTPPQVWVEKDSYLPLRAIIKPEGESEVLDIQPRLYQVYKSTLFPSVIDVFKGGVLWVRIEHSKAETISSGKFERSEHSHDYQEISGDLKDELKLYFKWIR